MAGAIDAITESEPHRIKVDFSDAPNIMPGPGVPPMSSRHDATTVCCLLLLCPVALCPRRLLIVAPCRQLLTMLRHGNHLLNVVKLGNKKLGMHQRYLWASRIRSTPHLLLEPQFSRFLKIVSLTFHMKISSSFHLTSWPQILKALMRTIWRSCLRMIHFLNCLYLL